MKDVIVIDTPDALLVTRVGHCQSVKKVAEFLKGGNRIEAEKHQAGTLPVAVRANSGMTKLFQSESMEMASARIAPGASLDLGFAANREIIVARGTVSVSTLNSTDVLKEGQRLGLDHYLATMLLNTSHEEVEVVMMTMHLPATDWKTEPITVLAMANCA